MEVVAANSINTNPPRYAVLRSLNAINRQADRIQNRVSTGLKVAGALDDASNFSIAQGIRGQVQAIEAVNQGLRAALGAVQVAVAGATAVSDTLILMREQTIAASNAGITTQQREVLAAHFQKSSDQLFDIVENQASFNGTNLIASDSTPLVVLSSTDGRSITVSNYNFSLWAPVFGIPEADLSDVASAQAMDAIVDAFLRFAGLALGRFGASARFLNQQVAFNELIADAAREGLGNIVDADLARESARLTAAQVQQQLATQTLGIVNSQPSTLLGLFR